MVEYVTDPLGRVKYITEGTGGPVLITYAYDDLSRRTVLSRANGDATAYYYNADSTLASLNLTIQGDTPANGVIFSYSYNEAGQLLSRGRSNDAYKFSYQASAANYVANALNQYSSVTGLTPSYDTRGNLSGDGKSSYSHDWQNRLNSVIGNGVNVNYTYDGAGRQRSKSVGGQVTQYVYDGSNLIAETDANGTVTRMHIFGSGVDEPLVSIAGGVKQYYHADERGSIIAETSSTGALIRRYSYGAYGEVDNPAAGSIFRFTGQRYDSETNLYYYKARTYSAALGRFLEPDPIGTSGGINIYAYAGDDPVNKKDPSGLDTCTTSPDIVITSDPVVLDDGTVIDGFTTVITGTTVCLPDPPPLNDPCAVDPNNCVTVTANPNNGTVITAPPVTYGNDPSFTTIGFTPGVGGVSGNGNNANNSTTPCNPLQNFGQDAGKAITEAGSEFDNVGLAFIAAGEVALAYGAVTGDVVLAAAGALLEAKGIELIGYGESTTFSGAALEAVSGASKDAVNAAINKTLTSRIPLPESVKSVMSKVLDMAGEKLLPEMRACNRVN